MSISVHLVYHNVQGSTIVPRQSQCHRGTSPRHLLLPTGGTAAEASAAVQGSRGSLCLWDRHIPGSTASVCGI